MKRLIIFLMLSSVLLAKEITIDEVVQIFNEDSIFIEKNKLLKERFYKEKEGLETNRNKKVDYSSIIYRQEDVNKVYSDNYEEKGQLNLTYDIFYYNMLYDFKEETTWYEKEDPGVEKNRIGIQKVLNDLRYSEEDYEKEYIKIKDKIVNNEVAYNYLTSIEEVVDLYNELVSINVSIDIDEENLTEYQELFTISKKKVSLGEGLALDSDYIEAEILGLEARIEYNKSLMLVKKYDLEKRIGRRIDSDTFRKFTIKDEVRLIVNDYDLRKDKNEIELKKEELKLKKRQEESELTVRSDYDTEQDLWSVRFELKGSFFDFPLDSELGRSDIEIYEKDIENIEREKDVELRDIKEKYEFYVRDMEVKKLKMENRDKTSMISKKMYALGFKDAKDYIDDKNDARVALVDYLEALNKLGAFQYKMKLRDMKL